MAEFDDRLNSLLSNPEAMDQIVKMAQSLMGDGGQESGGSPRNGGGAGGASTPPQAQAPLSGTQPPSGSGAYSAPAAFEAPPPRNPGASSGSFQTTGGMPGPDLSFFSGLGSIDPGTIASLLPILRELGGAQDSNARQLLFALRPYLKPERQDKVERALQLARLFRVGKKFLLKGDGHV